MKFKIFMMSVLASLIITIPAWPADVSLHWDSSVGATGYKVYMSTDNGATWDSGADIGINTFHTIADVPDSGLVLFRVAAYNGSGETIRHWSGAWYNGDWKPVESPSGAGID